MTKWEKRLFVFIMVLLIALSIFNTFSVISLNKQVKIVSKQFNDFKENPKEIVGKGIYQIDEEVKKKMLETPPPSPYGEEWYRLKEEVEKMREGKK